MKTAAESFTECWQSSPKQQSVKSRRTVAFKYAFRVVKLQDIQVQRTTLNKARICLLSNIHQKLLRTTSNFKSALFWITIPCNPFEGHPTFWRNIFLQSLINSEDGGNIFLRNASWLLSGLHGPIPQKRVLFVTTGLKTYDFFISFF
jgi:hypothetical protein